MLVVDMRLSILNLLIPLRYFLCPLHTAPHPLTSLKQAFIAVLKVRFKDVGLRKIESGEFALEDSKSKRDLQLTKPWAVIVRPGQRISMSMIFRLEWNPRAGCPGCGEKNVGSDLKDVEWYIYYLQV